MSMELYKSHVTEARCAQVSWELYINPMSLRQGVSMSFFMGIPMTLCLNAQWDYLYNSHESSRQGVSMSWELYKSHVIEARCLDVMGII